MIAFYMHGHIASSRVWVHGIGSSPFGECVVSSKIGKTSKIETHGCIKIRIINFMCLG